MLQKREGFRGKASRGKGLECKNMGRKEFWFIIIKRNQIVVKVTEWGYHHEDHEERT
jgi:hypothetical protein